MRGAARNTGRWPVGGKLVIDLRGAMPVAKGSMVGFVVKTARGPRAVVSDSKSAELKAYARDLRDLVVREMDRLALPCAEEQPFEVLLCYYMPRTKAASDRVAPWTKPDIDKLQRATLDALTGLCWDDDSRVIRLVSEKRFATKDRDVGVWIDVRVLPATMRELAMVNQRALAKEWNA